MGCPSLARDRVSMEGWASEAAFGGVEELAWSGETGGTGDYRKGVE